MRVDVIETPDLGDRSYVISDGSCAVVVDPQRDLDRVERLLADLAVPATLVLETHLHNDYVTGGLALARKTGATYVVAGRDEVAFERRSVNDGKTKAGPSGPIPENSLHVAFQLRKSEP